MRLSFFSCFIWLLVLASCTSSSELSAAEKSQASTQESSFAFAFDPSTYSVKKSLNSPELLDQLEIYASGAFTKLEEGRPAELNFGLVDYSDARFHYFSDFADNDSGSSHVYAEIKFRQNDQVISFQRDIHDIHLAQSIAPLADCNTVRYSDDGEANSLFDRSAWHGGVAATFCEFNEDGVASGSSDDKILVFEYKGTYSYSLNEGISGTLQGVFSSYIHHDPAIEGRPLYEIETPRHDYFELELTGEGYRLQGQIDSPWPDAARTVKDYTVKIESGGGLRNWRRTIDIDTEFDAEMRFTHPSTIDVPMLYYVLGEFVRISRNAY